MQVKESVRKLVPLRQEVASGVQSPLLGEGDRRIAPAGEYQRAVRSARYGYHWWCGGPPVCPRGRADSVAVAVARPSASAAPP